MLILLTTISINIVFCIFKTESGHFRCHASSSLCLRYLRAKTTIFAPSTSCIHSTFLSFKWGRYNFPERNSIPGYHTSFATTSASCIRCPFLLSLFFTVQPAKPLPFFLLRLRTLLRKCVCCCLYVHIHTPSCFRPTRIGALLGVTYLRYILCLCAASEISLFRVLYP